jgi:hypothetical protein
MPSIVKSTAAHGVSMASQIELEDALAIRNLRGIYKQQLGETFFDTQNKITIKDKLGKLAALYRGEPTAQIADRVLYLLLRHRMVLQVNGEGWYGVHPLVVDVLKEQGAPYRGGPGAGRGGRPYLQGTGEGPAGCLSARLSQVGK